MARPFRNYERDFALHRTAGHCWFCGKRVAKSTYALKRDEHGSLRYVYEIQDGYAQRYTTLLRKDAGVTVENLVCACLNCGSSFSTVGGMDQYRLHLMLRAIGLNRTGLNACLTIGVKPKMKWHQFWAEKSPGAELVSAFDTRHAELTAQRRSGG